MREFVALEGGEGNVAKLEVPLLDEGGDGEVDPAAGERVLALAEADGFDGVALEVVVAAIGAELVGVVGEAGELAVAVVIELGATPRPMAEMMLS